MSTFRIPGADLDGPIPRLLQRWAERKYGAVPDFARIYWHHKPVLWALMGFERRVEKWQALDPHLKSYAVMAAAGSIGCSWCLDYAYFTASVDGLDLAKVRQVPRWREADCFTDLEREVLAYAEAMTATPPHVTDEQAASLVERLGAEAMVELTQMVALENMRSRFNHAAGLTSQGYSDACELPLAVPSQP